MSVLTAFCDLQFCPVSYDAITFLVRAMLERDARKCAGLHVVFVPLEEGSGGFARRGWGGHDDDATYWRMWNIVIPACALARATVTFAHSREQATLLKVEQFWWPEAKAHFLAPLVDASRSGVQIPKLRATEAARRYVSEWLKGKKVVTLTLRNHTGDAGRNSNPKAWAEFAEWLRATGYHVITLDDTNDALKAGRGYCELSVDLRLALYEQSYMNVCANCGVQELLKFSHAPYILMGQATTEGWKQHFKKYFHLNPGDQVPWAGSRQKMVYVEATAKSLREHFEAAGAV